MRLDPQVQDTVTQLAVEATEKLFDAYGLGLQSSQVGALPEHAILMCGVIGFTGPQLRGTVILACNDAPLIASNPVPGSELRDWIAELTNQLVGRIKNRLLTYGAEIYITTPVVLRGEHLAPVPRHKISPQSFVTAGKGVVCVWTEVEAADGFALVQSEDAEQGASEGDAMMF
jgi:hypothetical protein